MPCYGVLAEGCLPASNVGLVVIEGEECTSGKLGSAGTPATVVEASVVWRLQASVQTHGSHLPACHHPSILCLVLFLSFPSHDMLAVV